MGAYDDHYRRSLADPEAFWLDAAELIEWERKPTRAVDAEGRWFGDGRLNTAYEALDRHVVAGRGDSVALVYDSPVTATTARWTFLEARDEVARVAGALRRVGVERGDRVLLYMPMIPEAVFTMLACARIGAVHVVVFGGFAAPELAARIDDTEPKVVITASCGIEVDRVVPYVPLVTEALGRASHDPRQVVIVQRPQDEAVLPGAQNWAEFLDRAEPAGPVPIAATDPLYVLHTSGTTGRPKGIIRDTGGHAVALAWSMRNVYGIDPGDVFWAASDIGWVVGHSYIVYAPLLAGATTVLYEGKPVGTPDAGAFWRVCGDHRVNVLFTAPTALRAIKRLDPDGELRAMHDLGAFRALFLAGERTDPDTYEWASNLLDVPVVDHWWQTETGWPVAANCLGIERLPIKAGSATKPVPGYKVEILGPGGESVEAGQTGAIALGLPLPPGSLTGLWNDPKGLERSYLESFPGYYASGDGGYIDGDGYLFVMGRLDDVINVAGHRLSTGAIEEVVAAHESVAECAVVGATDELKGQMPVVFVVLKAGATVDAANLQGDLANAIRAEIGPIATPRSVHVMTALPKTRSGKVLRAALRRVVDGVEFETPATIENPAALEEVRRLVSP